MTHRSHPGLAADRRPLDPRGEAPRESSTRDRVSTLDGRISVGAGATRVPAPGRPTAVGRRAIGRSARRRATQSCDPGGPTTPAGRRPGTGSRPIASPRRIGGPSASPTWLPGPGETRAASRGLVQRGGYVYRRAEAIEASRLLATDGPEYVSYRDTRYAGRGRDRAVPRAGLPGDRRTGRDRPGGWRRSSARRSSTPGSPAKTSRRRPVT